MNINEKRNARFIPNGGATFWAADEFNQLVQEVQNAITATGQALNEVDRMQLAKAFVAFAQSGMFCTNSYSNNIYTLTPVIENAPLQTNAVLRFIPSDTNSSNAPQIIYNGTTYDLESFDGTTIGPGAIVPNRPLEIYFNGTKFLTVVLSGSAMLTDGSNATSTAITNMGGAKKDLSNITTLESVLAKYETDWFEIVSNSAYGFDLSGENINLIGKEKRKVGIYARVKTAKNGYLSGDILPIPFSAYRDFYTATSRFGAGCQILFSGSSLKLVTGRDFITAVNGNGGDNADALTFTDVEIKIIVEGWKI